VRLKEKKKKEKKNRRMPLWRHSVVNNATISPPSDPERVQRAEPLASLALLLDVQLGSTLTDAIVTALNSSTINNNIEPGNLKLDAQISLSLRENSMELYKKKEMLKKMKNDKRQMANAASLNFRFISFLSDMKQRCFLSCSSRDDCRKQKPIIPSKRSSVVVLFEESKNIL